jgi:hypothetical protein
MKKLSLHVGDLRVESFHTAPKTVARGTVRGNIIACTGEEYGSTCCDPTQDDTCWDSCDCSGSWTCDNSCICPSIQGTACGLNGTCGCPVNTADWSCDCRM